MAGTITEKVEYTLKHFPKTRNDRKLFLAEYVRLREPQPTEITSANRIASMVQNNDLKYVPTKSVKVERMKHCRKWAYHFRNRKEIGITKKQNRDLNDDEIRAIAMGRKIDTFLKPKKHA